MNTLAKLIQIADMAVSGVGHVLSTHPKAVRLLSFFPKSKMWLKFLP